MKTKILVISPDIPYPLTKGGRQGMFHFIDKLRFEYEFSFLFNLNDNTKEGYQELRNLWSNVMFYPFEENITTHKKQSVLSKIYNLPYRVKERLTSKKNEKSEEMDFIKKHSALYNSLPILYSKQFIEYIKQIAGLGFNKIQVEFFPYLSLIHILPKDVEKIFIHHELRFVRNEIEISYFKDTNGYDEYVFKLSKEFEIHALNLYDKIVTVTETDKIKLQQERILPPIYCSPLIISKPKNVEKKPYKFNGKLTFIGSPGHFPNYDGLNWFIKEIWHIVNLKYPLIELHIIGGGWCAAMFENVPSLNNVFFDGYVENLKEILPNTIAIVPIRIGSGMRMKIIDSVNYHIPFITTSVGVEGLDFIDGIACFIADEPESFIQKLETLLSTQELQNKFIDNSAKVLDDLYSENELLNKRRVIYQS